MIDSESTIDPAITDPKKIPIPFKQLTSDENFITSLLSEISYKILKEDRPKPENVIPATKFIIRETPTLPLLSK